MDEAIVKGWEEKYEAASKTNPLEGARALLAYNSVIDKVRPLDEGVLGDLRVPEEVPPLFTKTAEDLDDLAQALFYSISNGLALEVLCSPGVIGFLDGVGGYEDRPGGQVLTVARLLSDFGASRIIVHPDRFDRRMASLYRGSLAEVSLREGETVEFAKAEEFYWDCSPEVHYILEFPAGLSFGAQAAPRPNRFIAAPKTKILFHRGWEDSLSAVSQECDLFFIAGLNHMGEDYETSFQTVRRHIMTAKAVNPSLKVHLEVTSVPDLRKREAIVEQILPLVDSLGLNETELADLAFLLGLPDWERVRDDPILQLEAMKIMAALGVRRVHMHTLGYYLCLSPNPAEAVRSGLLFASLIGSVRASTGQVRGPKDLSKAKRLPVAERGFGELAKLCDQLGLKGRARRELEEEGWCRDEDLVAIPTKLVTGPKYTVGLGDVISGASIFSEVWE